MINLEIDRMKITDLDEVMAIERQSFSMPWSRWMFERELEDKKYSHFLVVKGRTQIVGYIGFWMAGDEAHIVTIAVDNDFRNKGIGSLLLASALSLATNLGADRATLEVRVTNTSAQRLYEKFGFEKVAIRKKFYSDTGEDAYIMWLYDLQNKIGEIRAYIWKVLYKKGEEV
jgi:ribosomal-protein-alanine N-acetyltransferase